VSLAPEPLVPVEVDPDTPLPVVPFRLPVAVLPSLLGLPLRLVPAVELAVLEGAGEAFDSIQPALRASVPCIRQPVTVTRWPVLLERSAGVARRSLPVVCDVPLDPPVVDGGCLWSSDVCGFA
jgi:hypothetical protein